MPNRAQRRWRWIKAALVAAFLSVAPAQGALINLQAYIVYALLNSDGSAPLADGSIVQIIGSSDAVADPMELYGGAVIAEPTGDDLLIATITIQSASLGSNGTFFVGDYYYNSDEVNYMYLRFYDSPGPLIGEIAWGQSPITNAGHDQFGVIEMNFIGGYMTDTTDDFVVIPEPGTLNLLLVWATMVGAMRSSLKREQAKKKKPLPGKQNPIPMVTTYERF